MPQVVQDKQVDFVDRRSIDTDTDMPKPERRQFANSHDGLSSGAQELAEAIDGYKLRHRRRFITYEEIFEVMTTLGYHK